MDGSQWLCPFVIMSVVKISVRGGLKLAGQGGQGGNGSVQGPPVVRMIPFQGKGRLVPPLQHDLILLTAVHGCY